MSVPKGTLVRVALPVPLAQTFDYLPGPFDPAPGCRVRVPFGRSNHIGIVIDRVAETSIERKRLKPVAALLDAERLFDPELLGDLRRAADYWCGAIGEVVMGALPRLLREAKPVPAGDDEAWRLTRPGQSARDAKRRRGKSAALLEALSAATLRAEDLDELLPGWRAAARRLRDAGLIERCPAPANGSLRVRAPPPLTGEQRRALEAVVAAGPGFHAWLLQGVTGSGKTEVYLALAERILAAGRQVLWLVPEIGLVPQALRRLRTRFDARIVVLHSNLAEGERARAWLAARRGEAAVIVGARSAVFAPLPNAALIVVDEEHDNSYKQQDGGFRYHARDFALMRAQTLRVPLVLGSATPSLETLANAESGRYTKLQLRSRVHARPPSPVHVLDLRGVRLVHGLSPALLEALDACVARGEQALVFRNRRGYAPVLLCHACGWHAACPRCERPLTLHRAGARLRCHHCGDARPVPSVCPGCGARALTPQGHGTQRLEEALKSRYPDVPVLRVDRDSTRRRDAFDKLFDRLEQGGAAILVGTQMLAKGHDLPNLTTVAMTGVDEGLRSVDFRAGEKLAQLIVQVAGRAGRADRPGEVWLQTHEPGHPLLATLLHGGYPAAAGQLLEERLALALPPFAHMVLLRAEAADRRALDAFLVAAGDALAAFQATRPPEQRVRVDGPIPAPMPLRGGRRRAQFLVESRDRPLLRHALAAWLPMLHAIRQPRGLRWSVDVDPVDLY
jgi:primosomal protein N' (replication factor Y) (superfamily II helicase)